MNTIDDARPKTRAIFALEKLKETDLQRAETLVHIIPMILRISWM